MVSLSVHRPRIVYLLNGPPSVSCQQRAVGPKEAHKHRAFRETVWERDPIVWKKFDKYFFDTLFSGFQLTWPPFCCLYLFGVSYGYTHTQLMCSTLSLCVNVCVCVCMCVMSALSCFIRLRERSKGLFYQSGLEGNKSKLKRNILHIQLETNR